MTTGDVVLHRTSSSMWEEDSCCSSTLLKLRSDLAGLVIRLTDDSPFTAPTGHGLLVLYQQVLDLPCQTVWSTYEGCPRPGLIPLTSGNPIKLACKQGFQRSRAMGKHTLFLEIRGRRSHGNQCMSWSRRKKSNEMFTNQSRIAKRLNRGEAILNETHYSNWRHTNSIKAHTLYSTAA